MANLLEAYRRLDPANSPEGDELETIYTSRPDDPTSILLAQLTADITPVRALLAGQRGVGKSTELQRLWRGLKEESRQVLRCDVGEFALTEPDSVLRRLALIAAKAWGIPAPDNSAPSPLRQVVQTVTAGGQRPPILLIDGMERCDKDEWVLGCVLRFSQSLLMEYQIEHSYTFQVAEEKRA